MESIVLSKKILIMGLPGSGKTTFAAELRKQLQLKGKTVAWFNADEIRNNHEDWDFSPEGRLRQVDRMKYLSNDMMTDYVICDFVAPTQRIRDIFCADYTVWMNTVSSSKYEDTNKMFERPYLDEMMDYMVREKDAINTVKTFLKILKC